MFGLMAFLSEFNWTLFISMHPTLAQWQVLSD
ncbi:MAG: hypothetical protein ACI8UX_002509, partial [Psychromonas sp.]